MSTNTLPSLPPLSVCTKQVPPLLLANLSRLQLCSRNWIVEVSMRCSWMNGIKYGKLWLDLMLPTVLKQKLLCGLMKYISPPQNDFSSSETQMDS